MRYSCPLQDDEPSLVTPRSFPLALHLTDTDRLADAIEAEQAQCEPRRVME